MIFVQNSSHLTSPPPPALLHSAVALVILQFIDCVYESGDPFQLRRMCIERNIINWLYQALSAYADWTKWSEKNRQIHMSHRITISIVLSVMYISMFVSAFRGMWSGNASHGNQFPFGWIGSIFHSHCIHVLFTVSHVIFNQLVDTRYDFSFLSANKYSIYKNSKKTTNSIQIKLNGLSTLLPLILPNSTKICVCVLFSQHKSRRFKNHYNFGKYVRIHLKH